MSHITTLEIDSVRAFNRFYTARADLLAEGYLGTGLALAEVRLLFEIANPAPNRGFPTATDLCADLRLEKGYASRLIAGLERRGLVARTPAPRDARRSLLTLTPKGRKTFEPLDRAAADGVRAMLAGLDGTARKTVVRAMGSIRAVLTPHRHRRPLIRLRPAEPGDLGWVVERHGAVYAAEYGYDHRFEGLVAEIVADFTAAPRSSRQRCWIAEVDRVRAGCVFLVRKEAGVAQLRLLLVEPWARGLRLGRRLVGACTEFARESGYKSITLYTQSELLSARKLYVAEGYTLTSASRHADFGKPCVAEIWTLKL
jgi:DNA-binding MarR family transcriptional regulator/N-acetylglutamate synthase-like GNAT family acetyltransferase